jgi:predicted ATP-grasp superfamily ATP-dependent carboligase
MDEEILMAEATLLARKTVAAARGVALPALVIGRGLTALGVTRSLGSAGVAVHLSTNEPGAIAWSRWGKRTARPLDRPEDLATFLEDLPLERAVLFPCSDNAALAAASLPEALAARFKTSLPPRAAIETCIDKARFAEALRAADVPHPRTFLPQREEDLAPIGESEFDGFLKPCSSQDFGEKYGVKAFRVSGLEEAVARYRQAQRDGLQVVVQEYVPGPPSNHYFIDGFVDRHGVMRACFARQRIRMYPPDFGNSSFMTTVPVTRVGEAVQSLERLLTHLHYRGIYSAEFKLDPRDNVFRIVELNARPWWYIEFAAQCGVDTARMAYLDACGEEVPAVDGYDEGVSCVHLVNDTHCLFGALRRGRLGALAWPLRWLFARKSFFRWSDPGPWLFTTLKSIRSLLRL